MGGDVNRVSEWVKLLDIVTFMKGNMRFDGIAMEMKEWTA